jgi:hypothetical protein
MDEEKIPSVEEVESALGTEQDELNLSPEERAIVAKVLPKLTAKITAQAEANKHRELEKLWNQQVEENKKALTEKIEEIRKAMTPPSPDELQALLNQEYVEYTLRLKAGPTTKDFVIRELSIEVETKILKIVQKTLGERLTEIGQIDWASGMTMLEKLERVMSMVPGALITVSDCCAICLDPYGDDKEITGEWVRKNIGAQRLLAILHAQISVSRYRDFLSLSSRFFPGMMTQ